MTRVLVLLLALVALGPRPALADDKVTREQARQAFAAGEAADQAKNYRAAIEHYLRAYELVPHHFALYNIGIDYERLGEYREAAAWFDRYLQAGPPRAEADKVQQLLIALKLRPATLTVKTNVPGVRVFVDGQYSGSTPFAKSVRGGGRRIAVELNGQRDERDVYLEYGEPKEVAFTLRTVKPRAGPRGAIEITGTPSGATVKVDDQVVGRLPSARVDAIPGPHVIAVTRYGYQPWTSNATVEPDAVTQVPVQMVREGEPPIATGSPGAQAPAPGTPAVGGYPIPPPTTPTTPAGYVIGFGAGPDVYGSRGMFLLDFGARVSRFAVSFRYGKAGETYMIDLIGRVALSDAKLAPFVGGGVSYLISGATGASGGGAGLEAMGGVRYDVTRSTSGTLSLVAEAGVRYHANVTTVTGGMTTETSGIVIPVIGSIQWTYGRTRR